MIYTLECTYKTERCDSRVALLIILAFEHYLWSNVIIRIQSTEPECNTKAKDRKLIKSGLWEMWQLEQPGRDKSMTQLGY